jgi:hypothetical protein
MAIAAEALSPEAESAVSAAAAGHGKRLAPEVASELRRRASRKAKAAAKPAESSDGGGVSLPSPGGAVRAAGQAASSVATPSGRSNVAFRVILAFGAFLFALELASYLSGRYFSYSLGAGGQKLAGAAQHLDLYPGQSSKLALQKTLPPGFGLPGYGG